MKKCLIIIVLVFPLFSCSSGKTLTYEQRSRFYENQLTFHENEYQNMLDIGADGNAQIQKEQWTATRERQRKHEKNRSFVSFILDELLFSR
jgi:hypothetical protein